MIPMGEQDLAVPEFKKNGDNAMKRLIDVTRKPHKPSIAIAVMFGLCLALLFCGNTAQADWRAPVMSD